MSNLRRTKALLGRVLVIIALLVVGSVAVKAKTCEENELGHVYKDLPAPYWPTAETEIVHTRIGGRDFFVPRNYFRHPQIGCGAEESGMLLRVLLPDLKPYSEETRAEYEAQIGQGRKLSILLTNQPPIRPFVEIVEYWVDPNTVVPSSSETFGLARGLYRDSEDFYFSRIGREVDHFLRCKLPKPNRGASCQHRFRHLGHDVKISYDRKFLPEWQQIRASVIVLIDSFVATPADRAERP